MIGRLLLVLLPVGWLWAQADPPIIVSVVIEGNEVTRDHVILRELSQPLLQTFDSTLARGDRNRLYNLKLFESVAIYPRPTIPGQADLVVEVVETVRMIPLPIIYYLDDVGWSYGGGVLYSNFRGLNEQLVISKTFGGENTYALAFSDPWFIGNQIGVAGQVAQIFRGDPVYPFRTRLQLLTLGIGKTSRKKTVGITGELRLERRLVRWFDPIDSIFTVDTSDYRHQVLRSKIEVIWRITEIWRDPTTGFRVSLAISPVTGLDRQSPSYTLLWADGGWFTALRRGARPLVLGIGLAVAHYDQETPLYRWQYLGSGWVRGHDERPPLSPSQTADPAYTDQLRDYLATYETTNVATAGLELRQTLVPRRLWQQMEVGLAGILFVDAGWGYGPGKPLSQAEPLIGYGAGVRIYLPVINVLALDLGTNPDDGRWRYHVRVAHKF